MQGATSFLGYNTTGTNPSGQPFDLGQRILIADLPPGH
jgi:hypothetical protein